MRAAFSHLWAFSPPRLAILQYSTVVGYYEVSVLRPNNHLLFCTSDDRLLGGFRYGAHAVIEGGELCPADRVSKSNPSGDRGPLCIYLTMCRRFVRMYCFLVLRFFGPYRNPWRPYCHVDSTDNPRPGAPLCNPSNSRRAASADFGATWVGRGGGGRASDVVLALSSSSSVFQRWDVHS